MNQIVQFFGSMDPRAWYFGIAVVVGLFLYGWRKLNPASFNSLPPTIQTLSGALVGSVIQAVYENASHAETKKLVFGVLMGALSGFSASGAHHFLKASPLPYQGGNTVTPAKDKETP